MAERMANNLETFNGDISDYNNHLENLKAHFEDMVNHMNAMNNMWEGEAKDELLQTFETDRHKTNTMIDDFKSILRELRFAHTEYSDCETNVASMIDQMPI